jgi:hypothetical protein
MLQVEFAPVDGLQIFTVKITALAGRMIAALLVDETTTFAVVDDVLAI